MKRIIQAVTILTIAAILPGCSSSNYGGAPEPTFDVDKDLEQLSEHFGDTNSISGYYEKKNNNASPDELRALRNKFVTGRMTMMNIRYIQFIRKTTADRQFLDSAVDILEIGLNIAGVTFNSAATKTALAAAAAGVTGSKATIDKNYYFEKSIPALVAAMNAQRKKVLVPILEGMQETIDDYPFEQAVTDLHSYYFAGTFIGAIQAIQIDAGSKELEQDLKIGKVLQRKKATVEHKDKFAACTKALGTLKESDLEKAQKALDKLDPSESTQPANIEEAKEALHMHVIKANDADVLYGIFKDAGLIP